MADEFDLFLAEALSPAEREPDRAFVSRVQAHILLDQRLRAERRGALSSLAMQVIGLAAVAAAVLWLLRSTAIASFAAESPAVLLLALLAAFSFVILLFSSGAGAGATHRPLTRAFSSA
jgi:uncharacterized membrane protein